MAETRRGNRQLIRSINTGLVLDALRAADTLSQADLVRQTKLSVGTIVRIVADLKSRGLIDEVGPGEAVGAGRKPLQLRFNRTSSYVVGAEFAPDEVTIGILDLGGKILHEMRYGLAKVPMPEAFVDDFRTQLWAMLKQHRIARKSIAGLGISTHGAADYASGRIMFSRHLGWREVPLRDMLSDALKMPVVLDTHARTMTWAEYRLGAGEGATDLLVVEVDAGVGIVAIMDGRMIRGRHSMAGELGQNVIVSPDRIENHPPDIEDLASGKAMVETAAKRAAKKLDSPLHGIDQMPSLRRAMRRLFDAGTDGDPIAREVIETAAYYLGVGIANAVNLYDPNRVILAGSAISESRGMFVAHVRDVIKRFMFAPDQRSLLVQPAALGDRATIIGAATLLYDHLFDVDGAIVAAQ
jgi:predicted NBD/HSP70 family sugar kinase